MSNESANNLNKFQQTVPQETLSAEERISQGFQRVWKALNQSHLNKRERLQVLNMIGSIDGFEAKPKMRDPFGMMVNSVINSMPTFHKPKQESAAGKKKPKVEQPTGFRSDPAYQALKQEVARLEGEIRSKKETMSVSHLGAHDPLIQGLNKAKDGIKAIKEDHATNWRTARLRSAAYASNHTRTKPFSSQKRSKYEEVRMELDDNVVRVDIQSLAHYNRKKGNPSQWRKDRPSIYVMNDVKSLHVGKSIVTSMRYAAAYTKHLHETGDSSSYNKVRKLVHLCKRTDPVPLLNEHRYNAVLAHMAKYRQMWKDFKEGSSKRLLTFEKNLPFYFRPLIKV